MGGFYPSARSRRALEEPFAMNFLPLKYKVLIFLLLVPLLLAALPAFQLYRVNVTEQERDYLSQFLREGGATAGSKMRVPYGFGRYPRQALAVPMQEKLNILESQQTSLQLRKALSMLGLLSTLAASLLGVVMLVKVGRDSAHARRSFAFLVEHFEKSWQQVLRLQLLHIGLMLGTLVAAVLYEAAWSHSNWYTHGYIAAAMTLPLWGAIVAASMLLYRAFRGMTPPGPVKLDILGRPQSRAEAPGLWAWVDSIAERMNAPAPDHIVVGLQDCFYVTSADVDLHPSARTLNGRTLYLPLPYVTTLSQDETAAIIGHELGHFAHGDTEHGNRLAMVHRRMQQKIQELLEHHEEYSSWLSQPPIWTSIYVIEAFDHAYLHWSRVQEFAADQAGARAIGARPSAQALIRVTALASAIDDFNAQDHGAQANYVQALLDHLSRHKLELSAKTLTHAITHPVDTHPPTRSRIDALAVDLDNELVDEATRRPTPEDTNWFTRTLSTPPQNGLTQAA